LVRHVFAHQNGLIEGLTYEDLALRIGRTNRRGTGHGHGMGQVLGVMGHLLEGLEGEWGELIPHIQSLVICKTGPLRNLPDKGIKEFWADYPDMSRTEKENRTKIEHQRVVAFGSRWNDILVKLDLPRVNGDTSLGRDGTVATRQYGGGVESDEHKRLKEHIRDHPEVVGAAADARCFVEYPLPSLDEIDVVFRSPVECIAVEVKSAVSDAFPADYERGLYQTIKYGALLKAMALAGMYGIPPTIQSVLVLESALPAQFRKLSRVLGVTVIENIKPPG